MSEDHNSLPPTRGEGEGLPWADFATAPMDGRWVWSYSAETHSFGEVRWDATRQAWREPHVGWDIPCKLTHWLPGAHSAPSAAGQSLTEASEDGSSPLINEAQPHPPGGHSHEG